MLEFQSVPTLDIATQVGQDAYSSARKYQKRIPFSEKPQCFIELYAAIARALNLVYGRETHTMRSIKKGLNAKVYPCAKSRITHLPSVYMCFWKLIEAGHF